MSAQVSMPLHPKIAFFAAGMPGTKGSSRGFVIPGKNGGKPRAIVVNDAGAKAKVWDAIVSGAALDAIGGSSVPPLDGPLEVRIVFMLPRPKAHSTSKGLRPNAPTHVSKKPDADKLARCALDSLTGVVFVDDAQIARLVVEKKYSDATIGAHFEIERLST
jgi:hypothetical protein